MILWLFVGPGIAPLESVWPTSIAGWVGLSLASISFGVIVFDRLTGRGKNLQNIARDLSDLDSRVSDIENTDKIIEQTLRTIGDALRDITHELKGVDGSNGLRAVVRGLRADISGLKEQNQKMEVFRARFREIMRRYDGPERREGFPGLRELLRDSEQE